MARKALPTPTASAPAINHATVKADAQSAEQMGVLRRTQDSALEVGRLTGRIESMLFLRTCADRVIAETFIQLRESKKYKDLLIDDKNGNRRPCADLEEACQYLLGKSNRACRELAQNYEMLGADLYDKALQIGMQRNDYRAIRALPADEQMLVQHTIESAADRDTVADLIGELAERHAKKVAEKDQEIEAARRTREQRDTTINHQQATIDQLNRELAARTAERIAAIGTEDDDGELPELPEEGQIEALGAYARGVEAAIHTTLRGHMQTLGALSGDAPAPSHVRLAQQQAITRIIQAARVLAADFGIDLPLSTQTPQELAWLANMEELHAMDPGAVPQAVNASEVADAALEAAMQAEGWTLLGADEELQGGGDHGQ